MLPAAALAALLAMAPDQEPPLLERVEVSGVVIDARIVDGRGRVIPSLSAEQLRVEVDGTPVRLASVDWIDETKPHCSLEAPAAPQPFATSLEVGLKQVAQDTGGFYAKTHDSPAVAMARLTEALAGYYVITFEKPPGRRGSHQVNVSLVGRKGTVLARSGYVD